MVGFVLDGRESGPGARAFAEDVARDLARDGIRTHRFELVPTPVSAPRIRHSIRNANAWVCADPQRELAAARLDSHLDAVQLEASAEQLAAELASRVERDGLSMLHAIGLELAAPVAQRVHALTGVPYLVSPCGRDWTRDDEPFRSRTRAALLEAKQVVVSDEATRDAIEARFGARGAALRLRVVPRGADLEMFRPLPRSDRRRAALALMGRPLLAARLEGLDWDHACIALCVQPRGERHGFEPFLFAIPEVLRQQPALQIVVTTASDEHAATDALRAALAAGRRETLYDVLQTNELYQPLLDHMERMHAEGSEERWWSAAARLEPERRLRHIGPVDRLEFATLLSLADLFVMPGTEPRAASPMLYEALACGVLPLASEASGIAALADSIGAEISGEIAALCVLRFGSRPVREIEEKLGRILRLRPDLAYRLRALAVEKFDARQSTRSLRRLYGESARVLALRA